jgi:acyl-CoA synthetase (AMP-forming)/AMP-acid ligase II
MTILTIDVGLGAMVRANERRHGDAIAYIDGDRSLTHGELGARARLLASAFYRHGCRHQDRVAILSTNRLEYGEVYAACEISGIIVAPVNFRLMASEILVTVNDSGPKIVVFEDIYSTVIEDQRAKMPCVSTYVCIGNAPDWAVEYQSFVATGDPAGPPMIGTGDDIAVLLYTSGSTGRPKGCIQGQRELARLAQSVSASMRMFEDDRVALPMPFFHMGAKSLQIASHWVGGAALVLREFRPQTYLKMIEKYRITKCHLAPTMIQMLLGETNIAQCDLSSVNMIMYSSSAMPTPVLRRAIQLFGNVFQNNYGMSEGLGTALDPEQHKPDGTAKEQRRLQSVGIPLPNAEAMIFRDDGSEAEVGEAGEVAFKSEAMFRGYWNNSIATAEALRDGWYRTGDIGKMDEDGYIYLIDRKKDMIITGGENVYSREVEEALIGHSDILEAAVIGVPDVKWGEAVLAVIVPRPEADLTEAAVIEHCRNVIASYKKPRKVVFVSELPKFASGKINKVSLRQAYA